jgi:hypothetical protein
MNQTDGRCGRWLVGVGLVLLLSTAPTCTDVASSFGPATSQPAGLEWLGALSAFALDTLRRAVAAFLL